MHPWIIVLAGLDDRTSQFLSAPLQSHQMLPPTYSREEAYVPNLSEQLDLYNL